MFLKIYGKNKLLINKIFVYVWINLIFSNTPLWSKLPWPISSIITLIKQVILRSWQLFVFTTSKAYSTKYLWLQIPSTFWNIRLKNKRGGGGNPAFPLPPDLWLRSYWLKYAPFSPLLLYYYCLSALPVVILLGSSLASLHSHRLSHPLLYFYYRWSVSKFSFVSSILALFFQSWCLIQAYLFLCLMLKR